MYSWWGDRFPENSLRAVYHSWCWVRFVLLHICKFVWKAYSVLSVGLLYLWSADSIRKGTANGLEGALGAYD